MDGRKELLSYMGAATVTVGVLFTLQIGYASYLDVSYHAEWNDAPRNAEVKALREQEAQKLGGSRMPIDKAMQALAERGRRSFPQLAPQQSADLGAMSGWIHRPGFAAYIPRKPATAPTAAVAPTGPTAAPEGEVAAEAPAAPAEGAPAAEAAPEAAPAADAPAAEGEPAPAAPSEHE